MWEPDQPIAIRHSWLFTRRKTRPWSSKGEDMPDTDDLVNEIEAMFVQTAEASRSGPGTLTLLRVSPSTLYFSDRPERVVGHISAQQFMHLWDEGDDSFAEDPPNAVLASLDDRNAISDAVVVLQSPKLEGNQITYQVDVLEAELPAEAGPCALFLDRLGRPLAPMSVAGVHRRARRRARRFA